MEITVITCDTNRTFPFKTDPDFFMRSRVRNRPRSQHALSKTRNGQNVFQ